MRALDKKTAKFWFVGYYEKVGNVAIDTIKRTTSVLGCVSSELKSILDKRKSKCRDSLRSRNCIEHDVLMVGQLDGCS